MALTFITIGKATYLTHIDSFPEKGQPLQLNTEVSALVRTKELVGKTFLVTEVEDMKHIWFGRVPAKFLRLKPAEEPSA